MIPTTATDSPSQSQRSFSSDSSSQSLSNKSRHRLRNNVNEKQDDADSSQAKKYKIVVDEVIKSLPMFMKSDINIVEDIVNTPAFQSFKEEIQAESQKPIEVITIDDDDEEEEKEVNAAPHNKNRLNEAITSPHLKNTIISEVVHGNLPLPINEESNVNEVTESSKPTEFKILNYAYAAKALNSQRQKFEKEISERYNDCEYSDDKTRSFFESQIALTKDEISLKEEFQRVCFKKQSRRDRLAENVLVSTQNFVDERNRAISEISLQLEQKIGRLQEQANQKRIALKKRQDALDIKETDDDDD